MARKTKGRAVRRAKAKTAREAGSEERPLRVVGLSGRAADLLQRIERDEADSDVHPDDLHWFAVQVPAQRDMSTKIKLWKLAQRFDDAIRVWTPHEEITRPYSKFRPRETVRIRKPIVSRLIFVGVELDPATIPFPPVAVADDWTEERHAEAVMRAHQRRVRLAALARVIAALRAIEVVQGVIYRGDEPAYIPGRAMRRFRALHDATDAKGRGKTLTRPAQEAAMPRGREYAPGDPVRFEPGSGAFAHHKGRVGAIAETTCEVILELFGAERTVTVPLDAIGKASS